MEDFCSLTSKCVAEFSSRPELHGLLQNISQNMNGGVIVVTDCSGMSMPEMMLMDIASAAQDHCSFAETPSVEFWKVL